ncbi:hypothetical protein BpHYR1_000400 [Brachionus plicatilis]|uniref:Uncharacterized protein n=1 Tax=Brachionus plicatilis TaxID=10195 RepID=A0A3M7Q695_BRAPC|nr:hypothetical protein BpHYR1_000400 [Brachionus plicatilis]
MFNKEIKNNKFKANHLIMMMNFNYSKENQRKGDKKRMTLGCFGDINQHFITLGHKGTIKNLH